MKGYGSFCPIAKAAEVLAERWTLLILRDLLLGSRHFNDLKRGIPQISPTLLSKRLQTLEESGVIQRRPGGHGHGWEYHPTPAGEELKPLIETIGHWGQRWVRSRLVRDELDPGMLMWYVHRHTKPFELPSRRIVVYIEFSDVKRMKRWWMVIENGLVDLCLEDPGHEIDVKIDCDLLTLTQIYIGDLTIERARTAGKLKVWGDSGLLRSMPRWFARSKFADDNPLLVTDEPGVPRAGEMNLTNASRRVRQ